MESTERGLPLASENDRVACLAAAKLRLIVPASIG